MALKAHIFFVIVLTDIVYGQSQCGTQDCPCTVLTDCYAGYDCAADDGNPSSSHCRCRRSCEAVRLPTGYQAIVACPSHQNCAIYDAPFGCCET